MWADNLAALELDANTNKLQWLTHTGLLSSALKQCCNELSVQVYNQEIAPAAADEFDLLQLAANSKCFIRQVYLCGDHVPWVYARTVAPIATYLKYQDKFDNLAAKLLGESLLRSISNVSRSAFIFTAAITDWQSFCAPSYGARRSMFNLDGYGLLLTEVFLKAIPDYPQMQT